MTSIWAHSIVKNEERYIWYSLMSVINYVDKILIYDTGSTDRTIDIIKIIYNKYPSKIIFRQAKNVDPQRFTKLSQEMLESTNSDWVLILDGDEIWWEDSIKGLSKLINTKGNKLETIVQPYYNIIGDIFHYQDSGAGMYEFDGIKGFLTIRAFSRDIKGLHYEKEHGKRGLYDNDGILIQNRDKHKRMYLNKHYMHFTNMIRSENRRMDLLVLKRDFKYKFELGCEFSFDFYYPEVLFKEKPDIVRDVWTKREQKYVFKAALVTPLKRIKRKLYKPQSGY